MENYSVTQASNITAIAGVAVLILNQFHVNISNDEVSLLLGSVMTLGALVTSFVNRYKKGDLTVGGFRK